MSSAPHPQKHFEAIAHCAEDGILTISGERIIQYANPAIEQIFGYPSDELVGEQVDILLTDEQAIEVAEWVDQYLATGEKTLDWSNLTLHGEHRDGHDIPLRLSFSDYEQDGTTYFTSIVHDRTEQQKREARLAGLNYLAQELADAESREDVCESSVRAAHDILEYSIAVVEIYDQETGQLEPCSWTDEVDEITDGGRMFGSGRSVLWDVFVSQDGGIVTDLADELDTDENTVLIEKAIIYPIGPHGVLLVGEEDGISDEDANVTRILAGNAYSALERIGREETLREQKNQLQEKATSLDRVSRINTVIRDLTDVLTQAASRDEMLSEVCSRLVVSSPYRFVWFGIIDPASDKIIPETEAGVANGYLEDIAITGGSDKLGQEPARRAAKTRVPQVQNNIYQDPPFEPWQQEAIQRGYRASVSVPVIHQDTLYGVLNLYAGEANVFDKMEVTVLEELGETIGYALNADERKRAFTSQRSVELVFEITDQRDGILGMPVERNSQFELENLVERRDGSVTMFFAAPGIDPSEFVASAKKSDEIREIRLLTKRDDECLFECSLAPSTIWAQLLQRGSVVHDAVTTEHSTRIKIRIPQTADPRSYDALLEAHYGNAELVARRERDEPVITPEEFESKFRKRLTDRQDEVLQTAYYAGYFEWPREIKSSELADILGIAQPTVSRHLRSSERKLLSMVYDDSSGPG
ncbi:GAF domain-containing protein [Halobacteria archaeon AArc-curdl1]|uniref:GAF domain-containing protein n=1 Tax=Natronosalvus hydrolyticus TaxID=2979988 RepID=A0AAP3E943_9EURY|nr:GAF domain-containing protein [Halobacteria archaeon AArc-curdl1]